jgi:hypothetical protein
LVRPDDAPAIADTLRKNPAVRRILEARAGEGATLVDASAGAP